jgi:UDP:flavonoid glycosyltransferase YjiC (YdhE family)
MRILFTASPLSGHLRPMLPLLRAASAAGHQVVAATAPDIVGELQRRGYQTWSIGPAARETWTELRSRPALLDPAEHFTRSASVMFGRPGVARARDVLSRAAHWAPDVVVHSLTEVAGAEVAALTGALEIVVGPRGQVRGASDRLPLVTAELAAALSTPDRYADIVAAPYLDSRVPGLAIDRPTAFTSVYRVRPELDESAYRLPLRVQRFGDQRTVLLSLGRHAVPLSLLSTVLEGLRGFGINLIVETGPAIDPADLGRLPRNVAVGQVIDYARALPLCSGVISNASAELVVGALGHGLPMVNLPGGGEQLTTARRVSRIGAGITLVPGRLVPGAVRRALADLFTDPTYAAAARVQQAAIATMPSAEQRVAELAERAGELAANSGSAA